ncbi:MAG TPA: pyridoxamine 5'-phosphate oxidase family protein, partial [Anaerolineales bacterium]|nr:pyridoxamine 5'-phosphate oxidase family protein [Anaerolineales bacterium]
MSEKTDRPYMPGYGLQPPTPEAGLLDWAFVSDRMQIARNYWVATASPDGKPHAVPVWGVWHHNTFYFSPGSDSRKYNNLTANPQVV